MKESKKIIKVFEDANLEIFGFKKIVKDRLIGTIRKMYDGRFGFQPNQGFIIGQKQLERISNKLKNLNK